MRLFLPFRDNPTHLRDILAAIERIQTFVADLDLDAYRIDELRKSAVERQLQIITEAAKRLDNNAYLLCPDEDWKGFCRMGDVLRHGYHKIDDEIIWNTVKDELPKMREAVLSGLKQK
ncbi:MAG TPA: HepT-like ribonuclease domain-containing protein [Silvibacterium sp.]|nr:HepT-like ribonuclease domain-containing protein [Silvibacterium sp.]